MKICFNVELSQQELTALENKRLRQCYLTQDKFVKSAILTALRLPSYMIIGKLFLSKCPVCDYKFSDMEQTTGIRVYRRFDWKKSKIIKRSYEIKHWKNNQQIYHKISKRRLNKYFKTIKIGEIK